MHADINYYIVLRGHFVAVSVKRGAIFMCTSRKFSREFTVPHDANGIIQLGLIASPPL